MQFQRYLVFILWLVVSGCGSGSKDETSPIEVQNPADVVTNNPANVEDIACSTSYPLTIASISDELNGNKLLNLFDGNKTSRSSWASSSLDQSLIVTLEKPALLKQLVITWSQQDVSHLYNVFASKNKEDWLLLVNQGRSEKDQLLPEVIGLNDSESTTALYLKISLAGTELSQTSELIEIEAFGCAQELAHNIELIDWYLSVPSDDDDNGKSDSIKETELENGYFDPRFFSLSQDGGLTFTTSVSGYRTSANTQYVRSELREMLRRGDSAYSTQGVNKNNWVFSNAPQSDLSQAGGVNGKLIAKLAVNHVTSTGQDYQIGRVIIGQIHANDDEPVRLYYRKLPNNSLASVYIAHEILGGDDIYYELIGSRSNNASNPEQGIALNEPFSYQIEVLGNDLTVTIVKADGTEFNQQVDMSNSGYNQGGQYMYFKAGVYNQNNSGDPHDYVQATFYQIDNSHTGYLDSTN